MILNKKHLAISYFKLLVCFNFKTKKLINYENQIKSIQFKISKLFTCLFLATAIFSCNSAEDVAVTCDSDVTSESELFLKFASYTGYNYSQIPTGGGLPGFDAKAENAVTDFSQLADNPDKFGIFLRVESTCGDRLSTIYKTWNWDASPSYGVKLPIPSSTASTVTVIIVDKCQPISKYYWQSYLNSNPNTGFGDVRRVWKGTYEEYNNATGKTGASGNSNLSSNIDMKLSSLTTCDGASFIAEVQAELTN